jgi:PAS domain S-box-containing protein
MIAARPVMGPAGNRLGAVVIVREQPANITGIVEEIQREVHKYNELSHHRKVLRLNYLAVLGLLTLLILFAATWFALFVSKQVTIPIQALAEGTHQVSKGNLDFQVTAAATGELGTLIRSFNDMTGQLREGRSTIERATTELQRANRELEERSNTIEAILESIPTGVISVDPEAQIIRLNSTAERMFHPVANGNLPHKLSDLFSPEDLREVRRLLRRSNRQGVATQQMELALAGRRTAVALTVSSIRTRHGAVGSVLILEDLTELLGAQKSAAWQEVAQRLAHEIKNPLTPIQLSAERIVRLIERARQRMVPADIAGTVRESATLIGREVGNLKGMVDEFSSFARFPVSQPVRSDLNAIVEHAVHIFDGRLNGIRLQHDLASDLPPVYVDPAQMERAVINLIDNAAEAMEHCMVKEIWVRTALDPERDVEEIIVADSGPGVAAEAKEKLFLPYFSTKQRGTGLGLAIVSRIVAEHKGSIRVEENRPTGSKFVIELPADRSVVSAAQS